MATMCSNRGNGIKTSNFSHFGIYLTEYLRAVHKMSDIRGIGDVWETGIKLWYNKGDKFRITLLTSTSNKHKMTENDFSEL